MKINVSGSSGFCFGVQRAIKIAIDAAKKSDKVFMLGDIVHNENVVRDIRRAGVRKITNLTAGKQRVLLIRAHGAPRSVYAKAQQMGYEIIDATCPMVVGIHRIATTMEAKGYPVIVIGDKKHDEVRGILGQLKYGGVALDSLKSIHLQKIKKYKKACVVVQSTQDLANVKKILDVLKAHIPDVKFYNTICRTTRIRQDEMKRMPVTNDMMLIIGSRKSANTRRLYRIAKSLNKKSYWIQSAKDIKNKWFKNIETVGIMSGASTPDYTTNAVVKRIRKITS